MTDFIEFYSLLKMFEKDMFEYCVEKIRAESSVGAIFVKEEGLSRMRESINAKHLS
jgi:hypothetical protein